MIAITGSINQWSVLMIASIFEIKLLSDILEIYINLILPSIVKQLYMHSGQ